MELLSALFVAYFLSLCSCHIFTEDLPRKIVKEFQHPTFHDAQHLVIDESTASVFVGTVNNLYQLSLDLNLQKKVETGPKNDSTLCPPRDKEACPSSVTKELTDNVNKALIIDSDRGNLIVCGTLFQGACNVHDLKNVSNITLESSPAVVPNDGKSSTVAFIAPGPLNSTVMYVGASFTANSYYRLYLPAVSSRSLDSSTAFDYINVEPPPGTRVFISSLYVKEYYIEYVHGFSHEGFSYFLTVQSESIQSHHVISKLVRICQNDENYYSYTEVKIQCGNNFTDYNVARAAYVGKPGSALAKDLGVDVTEDVLFIAFTESDNSTTDQSSNRSAVCVYPMKSIKKKFTENISLCFRGLGERGLNFILPTSKCAPSFITIEDDFCGVDMNTLISGSLPITALNILAYDNTSLTALVFVAAGYDTILFLGTDDGHVKKVLVNNVFLGTKYEDISVCPGTPIKKDLLVDRQNEHLYVLSSEKVFKVKINLCSLTKTQETCGYLKDPMCGWCTPIEKCVSWTNCPEASTNPSSWMPTTRLQETRLISVEPNKLQKTRSTYIDVTLENIVATPSQYYCGFSMIPSLGEMFLSKARLTEKGVRCASPDITYLSEIGKNQAEINVKMSVIQELASTNFIFYDCAMYTNCSACVTSKYACNWCVKKHQCTDDHNSSCDDNVIIFNEMKNSSTPSGQEFCMAILPEKSADIFVPVTTTRRITFRIHDTLDSIKGAKFMCHFKIEGQDIRVTGMRYADLIFCGRIDWSYKIYAPTSVVPVSVLYEGNALDNPKKIRIILYDCWSMATDCESCTSLKNEYNCGWCESLNQCTIEEKCIYDSIWSSEGQICRALDTRTRNWY